MRGDAGEKCQLRAGRGVGAERAKRAEFARKAHFQRLALKSAKVRKQRRELYCGISEDPRDLQAGVDRQKADCRAYAERQGWTVVDTFIDNDTPAFKGSTRSGKQRTDYHRLIDAVKSGKFDVVVGYHSNPETGCPR